MGVQQGEALAAQAHAPKLAMHVAQPRACAGRKLTVHHHAAFEMGLEGRVVGAFRQVSKGHGLPLAAIDQHKGGRIASGVGISLREENGAAVGVFERGTLPVRDLANRRRQGAGGGLRGRAESDKSGKSDKM